MQCNTRGVSYTILEFSFKVCEKGTQKPFRKMSSSDGDVVVSRWRNGNFTIAKFYSIMCNRFVAYTSGIKELLFRADDMSVLSSRQGSQILSQSAQC